MPEDPTPISRAPHVGMDALELLPYGVTGAPTFDTAQKLQRARIFDAPPNMELTRAVRIPPMLSFLAAVPVFSKFESTQRR